MTQDKTDYRRFNSSFLRNMQTNKDLHFHRKCVFHQHLIKND